ncbi:hypothetical protein ACHAWF_003560 [Thalassiosira exigua]
MLATSKAAAPATATLLRAAAASCGGGARVRSPFQRRPSPPPATHRPPATIVRPFARSSTSKSKWVRRRPSPDGEGGRYDAYASSFDDPPPPKEVKTVLVIGSAGVLGRTLVHHFGRQEWDVLGADVADPDEEGAGDAEGLGTYVHLPREGTMSDLTGELYRGVSRNLVDGGGGAETKLDAVVCASGGWAGDVDLLDMMETHRESATSSELEDVDVEEEYARECARVCERMMRLNYHPIVAGSQVGRRFMKRGGLFVIIGASAALSPTPGMLGYGSAKAAAHHYLQTWGQSSDKESATTSVGILPLMIDTPANRAALGGDDDDGGGDERYSKMVKPIHIATEIGSWIDEPHLRPHSGSMVKVIAKERRDGSGGAAFHLVR